MRRVKVVVTRVSKECDELKDINMTTIEALERETKKPKRKSGAGTSFEGLCGAAVTSSNLEKPRGTNQVWKT